MKTQIRIMHFKCYNCGKTFEIEHKPDDPRMSPHSKDYYNGKIQIQDDRKIEPHECTPGDNDNVGIAYLMRVEESSSK